MAAKPKPKSAEIEILPVMEGLTRVCVLGRSPLVHNRVNEKAKRELLLPAGRRRSKADRAGRLKHQPLQEYRDSAYRHKTVDGATRLYFPSPAFKAAMATAALDLPGTAKTEIGRLVRVPSEHVDIFGVPRLFMAVVRNSGQNRTPDIRTRAILPRWACFVTIGYVMPNLTQAAVMNLIGASGILAGIGDGRQEKGKLSFGAFKIVNEDDPEFLDVITTGGREAQDVALQEPDFFDDDSRELYEWFDEELAARIRSGSEAPEDDIEDEDQEGEQRNDE